jgi:hypothetical protein
MVSLSEKLRDVAEIVAAGLKYMILAKPNE